MICKGCGRSDGGHPTHCPNYRDELMIADWIPETITRVRYLLEWLPICSEGSSGDKRRKKVEEALEKLEQAWALARL
jgi:hypothetical protein